MIFNIFYYCRFYNKCRLCRRKKLQTCLSVFLSISWFVWWLKKIFLSACQIVVCLSLSLFVDNFFMGSLSLFFFYYDYIKLLIILFTIAGYSMSISVRIPDIRSVPWFTYETWFLLPQEEPTKLQLLRRKRWASKHFRPDEVGTFLPAPLQSDRPAASQPRSRGQRQVSQP